MLTAWPHPVVWQRAGAAARRMRCGAVMAALCFVLLSAAMTVLVRADVDTGDDPLPADEAGAAADEDGAAAGEDGAAPADDDAEAGSGGEAESEPERVPYDVAITGVEGDLLDLMEKSSLLRQLEERPPATVFGLTRRAETDVERFEKVLRSRGYYDGKVSFKIDDAAEPVTITFTVEPGKPFVLAQYDIHYVGGAQAPAAVPDVDTLGVTVGEPAQAAAIVSAGGEVVDYLRSHGRPFAEERDRRAVVDFEDQAMYVDLFVDPGPAGGMGPVTFEGLERTKEDYVRQWIDWEVGEPFDQDKLDAFQSNLSATGLFKSVAVETADTLNADGNVAITVKVVPGTTRSVGASLGYSTDRGAAGRVFWEHRNLWGRDENLRFSVSGDFLQQAAKLNFTRPNFRELDRTLYARAEFTRSDTDAFQGIESLIASGLEWPLSEHWTASLGGAIEYSNLDENLDDDQGKIPSLLGGLPGTLSYVNTDSELDPTEGVRLDLRLTPWLGQRDSRPVQFVVSEVGLAGYYPVDADARYVLAGRVRVGSIVGEPTSDIPANKRMYAGGGGSIRGYEFQKVGPLDEEGDPIGGRSKIELSAEVRIRVWGDFGVVPFVSGGQVYESVLPDFSDDLQWAAGLGFRYYTGVGPLRLDFGFPINRRKGIDDIFQFYISLGQAF